MDVVERQSDDGAPVARAAAVAVHGADESAAAALARDQAFVLEDLQNPRRGLRPDPVLAREIANRRQLAAIRVRGDDIAQFRLDTARSLVRRNFQCSPAIAPYPFESCNGTCGMIKCQ
jgi:hypothetical protein